MTTDKNNVPASPHDNEAASAIDGPDQADKNSPQNHKNPVISGDDRRRRESAVIKNEAAILNRENLASAREDAALLREDTANARDDTANAREDTANAREDTANARDDTANARDDTANVREEVAHSREGAALLREENASSREFDIKVAETLQAASDEHMLVLKEANERLVIATVNAQILAEELQKTQVQLEKAKIVAETANLAKSNFLSSMSHELRTPLNAILGFAQLLGAGTPTPTPVQSKRIEEILKAGWYLLELINEILDLAVIESGKIKLSREAVSLTDIMRECQSMNEPQAQKLGIRIDYLPFDPSWVINADHTRVKQVINNLLSNAIKYNRANGTVEVACTAVTPHRIRISIRDTGEGLSAEKLSQLFQPFNRLGQEGSANDGTGIGLVVSKQLVELMNGSLGVESTVGTGSVFWIELNGDIMPQAVTEQTLSAAPAPQAQENKAPHTLLYVEDNPANLLLVEQIIERYPHIHMLSARDGNQGIALARTHLPDVILMDINLPGISGIQALKILREDPATMHIPVIALSANAMLRDIEIGLKAGFFRYLTKPIKINEIVNTLNEALEFSAKKLVNANKTELTPNGKN